MIEKISDILDKNNVPNYNIKGRIKNIYSVYKKCNKKH